MTQREARKLRHGLYRLWWKSGDSSLAAVGSLYDGTRWFAPTNWTAPAYSRLVTSVAWRMVQRVERIEVDG